MKIFCVIPAYNEEGNLAELCQRLVTSLKREKIDFKIFFILQGAENNLKLIKRLALKYQKIDYLYFPYALGIGKAYRIGFENIKSNYTHILTLDADLNHRPEELPKFIKLWKKTKADIIIGSRFIAGGKSFEKRRWKKIASGLINKLINKILNLRIADKSSGYRLINKKVILKIRDKLKERGYPSYIELILLAQKYNFTIREVPITYIPRNWGKSKMSKTKTLIDYFFFLIKIFFNF